MSADKLYFKDENEGCKKTVIDTYCDCNGEEFCVAREEDLPYIQKHEILAPVFIDMYAGNNKFLESLITMDTHKIRKKTILHLKTPLKLGDIIKVKGYQEEFYIFSFMGRDNQTNFKYEIKRADCFSIVLQDIQHLKKGVKVRVVGFFK